MYPWQSLSATGSKKQLNAEVKARPELSDTQEQEKRHMRITLENHSS